MLNTVDFVVIEILLIFLTIAEIILLYINIDKVVRVMFDIGYWVLDTMQRIKDFMEAKKLQREIKRVDRLRTKYSKISDKLNRVEYNKRDLDMSRRFNQYQKTRDEFDECFGGFGDNN